MANKLLQWIVFSVAVGLMPIIFTLIHSATIGANASLDIILGRGELIMVSCLLSATALGELVSGGKSYFRWRLFSGGGCLCILLIASFWFATISTQLSQGEPYNRELVATWSIPLFFITIAAASGAIILAEMSNE